MRNASLPNMTPSHEQVLYRHLYFKSNIKAYVYSIYWVWKLAPHGITAESAITKIQMCTST